MLPSPPPFAIFARVRSVHAGCPDTPNAVTPATLPVRCTALDVIGHLDPGDVSLDPAFDVLVPSAQLLRGDPAGNVTLTALAADGTTLFAVPFLARDSFHVDVPVSPAVASAVRRIRLTTAAGTVERAATTHGEPAAEIIGTDERNIVIAWDAFAFPAIRIMADNEPAPTIARGTSTYQQTTIGTVERYVTIDFSDGVRSVSRRYRIFGR